MRVSGPGGGAEGGGASPVTVVVATRNRRPELLGTLDRLTSLPDRPPVVVVDNGSSDGTAAAVRRVHPEVEVVALPANMGSAARNLGARRSRMPYIAFNDDDSWWEAGALEGAAALLDRHPRVGLVAGRVLVGAQEATDPVSDAMAASALGVHSESGRRLVLGFLACAAVVRARAFEEVGGFSARLGVGGEETLLALDLAAAGWDLVYDPGLVVHHHPSTSRDPAARARTSLRNALWTSWLRQPAGRALRETLQSLRASAGVPAAWPGLADACAGAPWVLRNRRALPAPVAASWARLRR